MDKDAFEKLIRNAVDRLESNDFPEAIQGLTRAIRSGIEDSSLLEQNEIRLDLLFRWRSEAWFRFGEYSIALSDINQALCEAPTNAEYWAMRADIYHRMSRNREALCDLNRAIDMTQDDQLAADYRYLKGRSLFEERDFESARREVDQALSFAEQTSESSLKDFPRYYMLQAKLLFQEGSRYKALELAQKIADLGPGLPETEYEDCAQIFFDLGEEDRAIEIINRSPKARQSFVLAERCFKSRQYPAARDILNNILEVKPLLPEALLLRAKVHYELSQYDSAIQDALNAYKSRPNPKTASLLGTLYRSKNDYVSAAKWDRISDMKTGEK